MLTTREVYRNQTDGSVYGSLLWCMSLRTICLQADGKCWITHARGWDDDSCENGSVDRY